MPKAPEELARELVYRANSDIPHGTIYACSYGDGSFIVRYDDTGSCIPVTYTKINSEKYPGMEWRYVQEATGVALEPIANIFGDKMMWFTIYNRLFEYRYRDTIAFARAVILQAELGTDQDQAAVDSAVEGVRRLLPAYANYVYAFRRRGRRGAWYLRVKIPDAREDMVELARRIMSDATLLEGELLDEAGLG
jgi:hypothetical protein